MQKNTFMFRASGAVAALVLMTACTPKGEEGAAAEAASAEGGDVDAVTHMQLTASEGLQGAMDETFTPEQVSLLEAVAHQFVISQTCDGFELDVEKAGGQLAKLHQDKDGKDLDLSADEKSTLEKKTQLAFGMALGSQMTISGFDQEAFCNNARDEKPENPDDETGYILTAAAKED